jgi:ATP/maltotriose-dependent transcriptional regulator MalT
MVGVEMVTGVVSVPDRWPLVGRDYEIADFTRLLVGEARGLLLAGPAGVGKTRLAEELLRIAAERGCETVHVTATRAASALPMGALAPFVPAFDKRSGVGRDDQSDLLSRYARALVARAGGRRLVLFVDDVHALDGASATLVHQMAASGAAFVLLTTRNGEPAPDPMVTIWKDGLVSRLEVRRLGVETVGTLLREVLGGRVDSATITYLTTLSQGRALFLRELVLGSVESGALGIDNGIWRMVGPFAPSDRLITLVEARLEGLRQTERDILEVVSFGEPVGPAEISKLADPAVVGDLERKGLLTSRRNGRRLEFRMAHPLFGEVLRGKTPALRACEIARLLADAVEATGARRQEDVLRIGTWRLEGGGGSPELFLAAATIARWRYDFALAERLGRAAIWAGAGFDAVLLVAHLLNRQGRYREAERELATLTETAHDDTRRGLVAIEELDTLAFFRGQPERAIERAQQASETITDPDWSDEIASRTATILLGTVGPRASVTAAMPLMRRAQGRALVWACVAAEYGLMRMGRIQEAVDAAIQGHAAHLELTRPLGWDPCVHLMFRCDALAHAGRFSEAEELAAEMYQQGIDERSTDVQAYSAYHQGKIVLDRGNVSAGIHALLEAIGMFHHQPQIHEFMLISLATAYALAGQVEHARETLCKIADLGLPPTFYMRVDFLLAHAWTEVAAGDLPRARQLLLEASDIGEDVGDLVGKARALHSLARLGWPREAAEGLEDLARRVQGDLIGLRADHARALARDDAEALDRAAAGFERLGAYLLAAEASADAAVAWTRDGQTRNATGAARRLETLRQRCAGAATPALQCTAARSQVTQAERRVGLLAATGMSNKEIAAKLQVSVRTIESELHHLYQKLGIRGRRQIGEALGSDGPRSSSAG